MVSVPGLHCTNPSLLLFDYCSAFLNPTLKCVSDLLEDCQEKFLRTIQLSVLPEGTTDDHYYQRLSVINWDPLIVRRIKHSLVLAHKMLFRHIPCGDFIFEPFVPPPPESSVAVNTI